MITGGYSDLALDLPLHKYQKHAVDWMLQRFLIDGRKGCALFLDPGLGKTRTTLTLLDILFDMNVIRRALVVAPLRPLYTVWPDQINEWGFPQRSAILHKQEVKAMGLNRPIELMNFDSLKKIAQIKNRWDMIVIDESSFVKNWSSKRMSYVRRLLRTIPYRIILNGTPTASGFGDLFSQMYIVDDGEALGKTIGSFRAAYCRMGGWQGRKHIVKKESHPIIREMIRPDVLAMKCEDYLDMPELVFNDIWINLPEPLMRQYRKLKKELFVSLGDAEVIAGSAAAAYSKCWQFTGGSVYEVDEEGERVKNADGTDSHIVTHNEKIDTLCELYEELAGKPMLVFYWFKHQLAELLARKDLKGVVVLPKNASKAKPVIDKWNAGKIRILACQWQAASHGLNLQESCLDIACLGILDSFGTFDQAYRRVYRQGVKGQQVRVHRILARGTIDEVQLERLGGHHETTKEFVDAIKRHARG